MSFAWTKIKAYDLWIHENRNWGHKKTSSAAQIETTINGRETSFPLRGQQSTDKLFR